MYQLSTLLAAPHLTKEKLDENEFCGNHKKYESMVRGKRLIKK